MEDREYATTHTYNAYYQNQYVSLDQTLQQCASIHTWTQITLDVYTRSR